MEKEIFWSLFVYHDFPHLYTTKNDDNISMLLISGKDHNENINEAKKHIDLNLFYKYHEFSFARVLFQAQYYETIPLDINPVLVTPKDLELDYEALYLKISEAPQERVVMPNGVDGLICSNCSNFIPYAETNEKIYKCRECL